MKLLLTVMLVAFLFGGGAVAQPAVFKQGEVLRAQAYYCAGETEALDVASEWVKGGWPGFMQAYQRHGVQEDALGDPVCGIVRGDFRAISGIGSFSGVGRYGQALTYHLIWVSVKDYLEPFVIFSPYPFAAAGNPA